MYWVLLKHSGRAQADSLPYEGTGDPREGDLIVVGERYAEVERTVPLDGGGTLLECWSLFRFLLLDEDGSEVGPGEWFQRSPEIRQLETFMTEAGKRFRVLRAEDTDREGYDGAWIIEEFPG